MNHEALRTALGDWYPHLEEALSTKHMATVNEGIRKARERKRIYPESHEVLKAFSATPLSKVKVVWLGQDPYNRGEANGLSFDCSKGTYLTPSWRKILDTYFNEFPQTFPADLMEGDLSRWAEQGVFLYNVSLTVPHGEPLKHMQHWSPFSTVVIETLLKDPSPKCFVLIGGWAKVYQSMVYPPHGTAVYEHPAYAARQNRDWNAEGIFGKINRFLEDAGRTKIDW